MSPEVITVLEQYRTALATVAELREQVLAVYKQLPDTASRLRFVLENGFDFLTKESWYCPRVRDKNGREVSLHDDLYWERRETNDIHNLVECISDNLIDAGIDVDWDEVEDLNKLFIEHAEAVLAMNHPAAVILKDMLDEGIGEATFDW